MYVSFSESHLNERNTYIDGLRGFCAVYVVFFHCCFVYPKFNTLYPAFQSFVMTGAICVQVFFCLSGFLVFSSIKKISMNGGRVRRQFYIRRILRILPLWWGLLFFRYFIKEDFEWDVLLANMFFFFGDLGNDSQFLPIIPSWSLLSEEVFYIILPLFFTKLRFYSSLVMAFLFILISPFVYDALFWMKPEGWSPDFVGRNPLLQFQFFFMGIALYYLINEGLLEKKIGQWMAKYPIVIFDIVTLGVFWNVLTIFEISFPLYMRVFAIIINIFSQRSLFCRMISHPLLKNIGIWCFGIYILQEEPWFILHFIKEADFLNPYLFLVCRWLVCLMLLIPLAALIFRFYERPIMKWGRNYFRVGNAVGKDCKVG